MTSWIVKIGKNTPEHWDFAREDRFWDVREPSSFKKIKPGEDVFFWLSGTGFRSWVRATSSLYPIGIHARTAHWVDRDTGGYTHRFEFEVISDDVTDPATWSELQDAAGRNYAPPAPANPVEEPSAEAFLRARFGRGSDISFGSASLPVEYSYGDDLRERAIGEIVFRRGQGEFRDSLIAATDGHPTGTVSPCLTSRSESSPSWPARSSASAECWRCASSSHCGARSWA